MYESHPNRMLDPRLRFNWEWEDALKPRTKFQPSRVSVGQRSTKPRKGEAYFFTLIVEKDPDSDRYTARIDGALHGGRIDVREGFLTRIHAELWAEKRLKQICAIILDLYTGP